MVDRSVYSDAEWGLLTGLPQSVVIAACSAEPDGSRRTQAESVAGMEAIAAGRESGHPLVEALARELVERVGDPEAGDEAPAIEFPDPDAGIADVLTRAREARVLLAARTGEDDAAAFGHWLVGIAEAVATAAKTGGVLGIGGDRISAAERSFLDDLRLAVKD